MYAHSKESRDKCLTFIQTRIIYVAIKYFLCDALWKLNGMKGFKSVVPPKCQHFIN